MTTASLIARLVVLCMGVTSATTSFAQSANYLVPPITNWTHPPVAAKLTDSSATQASNPKSATRNMADLIPPAPLSSTSSQGQMGTTTSGDGTQFQSAGIHANTSTVTVQPTQNMTAWIRPAPMAAAAAGPVQSAKSKQSPTEQAQAAITPHTTPPAIGAEDASSLPKQASDHIGPTTQRPPLNAVQALFDLQASGRVSGSPVHLLGSDMSASYARFLHAGKGSSSDEHTTSAGSAVMPDGARLTKFGSQP